MAYAVYRCYIPPRVPDHALGLFAVKSEVRPENLRPPILIWHWKLLEICTKLIKGTREAHKVYRNVLYTAVVLTG